jgi:hypothetical protein
MHGGIARQTVRMSNPRPNADRSGAGINIHLRRERAIIPALDQFQRDFIRVIAMLFGPMLVGAIVIPLLMMVFALLGYSY